MPTVKHLIKQGGLYTLVCMYCYKTKHFSSFAIRTGTLDVCAACIPEYKKTEKRKKSRCNEEKDFVGTCDPTWMMGESYAAINT